MLLDRGGQLALELERLSGRGIWVLTRADADYPARLKSRLRGAAPPVLFGAGPRDLPDRLIAIVGSRDVDEEGLRFTAGLARSCAAAAVGIVSGGAKGTDAMAQESAVAAEGRVVSVLADSLERTLQQRAVVAAVRARRLTLLTAVHPATPFAVGIAMGRNRLIYCLSDVAVVIASAAGEGGTWAGAAENLERRWAPLRVADYPGVPDGNRLLMAKGGQPLLWEDVASPATLSGIVDAATVGAVEPIVGADPDRYPEPVSGGHLFDAPMTESVGDAQAEPTVSGSIAPAEPIDAFTLIVDRIRDYCREPRTADEVGQAFVLERAQVKAWLARAVKEGGLKKLAKPVRYVAVRSLFSA
jgi:predicted Rossmann fold nucleotide-binding protein DprA/Smf involved in DNA uptake